MMPRLNGIQAVERINDYVRQKNKFVEKQIEPPKIYFLTAHKTSHFDRFLEKLDVSAVYEKPLSPE